MVGCPPVKGLQANRVHHLIPIVAPSDAAVAFEPDPDPVPVQLAVMCVDGLADEELEKAGADAAAAAASDDDAGAGHADAAGRGVREQHEGTASDEVAVVAAGGDAS